ncbi:MULTISPECIES: homoserine kinase [Geobacillus]|jgi:homoserine kinase|uniref:Homoserine kinase n=2 Tax=Geobacillus thermodenitrificans TaxID=33940 RepID=A4ISF3_GEOTN|nr:MULTISPECIES: homoserine kinase [Geobacillus]ABO68257.1 Homoserine kinase [Geobacillus thermodenitrificans NG80-2]ARA98658.1 homoserine kinase [Geobacillus thermodenitrificans]KQB91843.1 Homoserine kinase [Geobacillus sp. PA-3]MED0662996.1 homoserine kinase [Geobacillus thermodenitrificans]MED3717433.1 homoserine kinase [Geobacillus thermodenitrificans]
MKEDEMLKIVVPGSTANLGPGFDSVGLAVSRYLTLDVRLARTWSFTPKTAEVSDIPRGTDNLVYKVANETAKAHGRQLPSCEVDVYSDIPFTRGLGSSAAAVVAGIELADALLELGLTREQKMELATRYEGHPDNVGASLYGGLVIGCYREAGVDVVHVPELAIELVAIIPAYELETKKARGQLPEQWMRQQAVEASAISNVLVAALLTKNWKLAGRMMAADLFHQPYRKSLVPELERAQALAEEYEAIGAALSGAGPTVLVFAEPGKGEQLERQLRPHFPACEVTWLAIEPHGSRVYKLALEA